jgi:hypothetical protein
MRKIPLDEPDAVDTVQANLEKIARYRNVFEIRNPDKKNPLDGMIDLVLLRQNPDEKWGESSAGTGGEVIFHEGDRLGLRIINRYHKELYVTILDFGLSHGITALFPVANSTPQLKPGTFDWAVKPEQGAKIELYFPPHYEHATGEEFIKLIATTQPTDFRLLQQDTTRDGDRATLSPLDQLFMMANDGTRDGRVTVTPVEDWITLVRPFILKRKEGT